MTPLTVDEMKQAFASGTVAELRDFGSKRLFVLNCSRCGRPYAEHPHGPEDEGVIPNAHAFRTQPEVGRLIEGYENGDGLVYVDGRWDGGWTPGSGL